LAFFDNIQLQQSPFVHHGKIMPPKQTKATVCEKESVVTMRVLSQILERQREFYKDILTQQQENFKCFIQVIIERTNIEDKSGIHTTNRGDEIRI